MSPHTCAGTFVLYSIGHHFTSSNVAYIFKIKLNKSGKSTLKEEVDIKRYFYESPSDEAPTTNRSPAARSLRTNLSAMRVSLLKSKVYAREHLELVCSHMAEYTSQFPICNGNESRAAVLIIYEYSTKSFKICTLSVQ